MSGHSKWHKIRHKKAATDSKKSKLFGALARDIKIAARAGTDPDKNIALREAVDRAKKANLPQTNIDRLLSRDASKNQSVTYEGYGAGGVAVLVTTETDNTNRTVAELRSIFKNHGGSLGEPGSVKWKFSERALIKAVLPQASIPEELELTLIEAGADDLTIQDNHLIITTPPTQKTSVEKTLLDNGIEIISSELTFTTPPSQQTPVSESQQEQLEKLQDELQEHDDVIDIYTDAKK